MLGPQNWHLAALQRWTLTRWIRALLRHVDTLMLPVYCATKAHARLVTCHEAVDMEEGHHEQRAVPVSQLIGGYNVLQAGCQVGVRQGDALRFGCRACRRSLQWVSQNAFAAPYAQGCGSLQAGCHILTACMRGMALGLDAVSASQAVATSRSCWGLHMCIA